MFEEPEETPGERPAKPADRAKDKSDEFRMHAELASVFEATRKFEADLKPGLDAELARTIQRTIGKLEKLKVENTPVLNPEGEVEAAKVLDLPNEKNLSTNDYHIYRRPGEVMIVRWIEGDQVDKFYERLQAHFDAALNQFRQDEREALEWKQAPDTKEYLEALEAIDIKMADKYVRQVIKEHKIYVLSTQTADEIDILHLCELIMGVSPYQLVGEQSAPPEDGATEQDRAWFFKLFSLRGVKDGQEQMCFFAFMQKTDSW